MSVKIKIVNREQNSDSDEYKAAVELQDLLKKTINQSVSEGTIYIGYGFTLTGQPVRDIDIVVAGSLQNCRLKDFYEDPKYGKHDVIVNDFFLAIELKKQSDDLIHVQNTHIYVDYPSTNSTKDATGQNEKQRYALSNYFYNAKKYKTYVTNALWMKGMSDKKYLEIQSGNPKGVIPREPSFSEIIKVICQQGGCKFSSDDQAFIVTVWLYDIDFHDGSRFLYDFNEEFGREIPTASGLTRKKMELLSQSIANKQLEKVPIGEKLTIFSGRAGTGKTINLIQTALLLADNTTGKRCLILTYNHALVSDINRLLFFQHIPDKVDSWTIQIETLDKFFRDLMLSFGLDTPQREEESYDDKYQQCISNLNDFIKDGMTDEEVHEFKNTYAIDWDYILVDEAQDWSDEEKSILFKLYGPSHIVVADGVDQFVRSHRRQPWAYGIKDVYGRKQEYGLRQKSNLVDFVNALANKLELNWSVKPTQKLNGGDVYIYDSFNSDIHIKMINHCRENDCENYDILYLIPKDETEFVNNHHQFKRLNEWRKVGINIFDGTNEILRRQFPQDLSQCRMYMYQSCRGLEGWVTACLKLDLHVDWLIKNLPYDPTQQLGLGDEEEQRKKAAYLWSLIPLTRPISQLIITLDNTDSEYSRKLKEIADEHPDYVHWMIK